MFQIRATLAASILAFCATAAQASPVLTNSAFGNNTLVFDAVTGLSFLNVTLTRGMSYNTVAAQLGTGGTYQGYRYATAAEAQTLFNDFGIPSNEIDGVAHANIAGAVTSMLSMLGTGDTVNATAETYALVGDSGGAGNRRIVYYATVNNGSAGFLLNETNGTVLDTATQVNVWGPVTSLLVQNAPEPMSIALFASALVGLAAVRRR